MVKNVKGGKGHKSIARKSLLLNDNISHIRLPENALELFAVVTKFYGNMCDVTTHNKLELKCHIRGKFKGKSKRNSHIATGKIILVGLRHYETQPKTCDLLYVFESISYPILNSLQGYDMASLFNISSSLSIVSGCLSSHEIYNNITFSEEEQIKIYKKKDLPEHCEGKSSDTEVNTFRKINESFLPKIGSPKTIDYAGIFSETKKNADNTNITMKIEKVQSNDYEDDYDIDDI
jgi:translation initiation factor IF-1